MKKFGGDGGIRTPVDAFAERCLTPRPHHRDEKLVFIKLALSVKPKVSGQET